MIRTNLKLYTWTGQNWSKQSNTHLSSQLSGYLQHKYLQGFELEMVNWLFCGSYLPPCGDMEKITNNFQWRWCILLCIKEGKNHRLFNKSDLCQALKLGTTSLHPNISALKQVYRDVQHYCTLPANPDWHTPGASLPQQEFISCSLQILPPLCSPNPISYHPTLPIADA